MLTHDGVAPATAGKVIDLGFNGDFDIRKSDWNNLFVAFPAKANATTMTMTVYTVQENIDTITSTTLATVVIPAYVVQRGGTYGIRIPRGVKRYITVGFTGTTLPDKVTAGVTDVVDSQLDVDWTNYDAWKAANDAGESYTGKSEVEGTELATKEYVDTAVGG